MVYRKCALYIHVRSMCEVLIINIFYCIYSLSYILTSFTAALRGKHMVLGSFCLFYKHHV